jgi:hypothetical protein
MRIRNTIIALILLVIVGGIIYLTRSHTVGPVANTLYKIRPDDITQVTLKYPDREIVLARGQDGKWNLLKPIKAPADNNAVNTLTREIANCQVTRTVVDKAPDLRIFGLDKPQVVITVVTRKGPLPAVEVGNTTPIGYHVYIKTVDKPAVMLTAEAFSPGTKRTVEDLRDHSLLAFNVNDVNKLTIKRADSPEIEIDKVGGKWTIVQPAHYKADAQAVRGMLSSLSNARISEFINDHPTDLKPYGLDKPRIQLSVYSGKGEARQSLDVGTVVPGVGKEGYYVQRGETPAVYTIHNWLFADMDKDLGDLRDRTVLAFEPSDVHQIKVTDGAKSFVVSRQPAGKWTVSGDAKGAVDPVKVEQFMDHLRTLRGNHIVTDTPADLSKFGLSAPQEEIVLLGNDGKPLGSVKLAKIERHNDNNNLNPLQRTDYYAMSSAAPTVYSLYSYDFDDLNRVVQGIDTTIAESAPKPAAKSSPQANAKS